jgi:hypothetical protein
MIDDRSEEVIFLTMRLKWIDRLSQSKSLILCGRETKTLYLIHGLLMNPSASI